MALTVGGWTTRPTGPTSGWPTRQLPDGSWFNYYLATGIEGPAARHQRLRLRGHRGVAPLRLDRRHRRCSRAVAGGGGRRRLRAAVAASRRLDPLVARSTGFLEEYALLTGSSSIYHSLRCAIACAERLGHERPDWELAAGRLAHAVAHQPDAFAPKEEFAMDWYYPVLAGALSGEPASRAWRSRGRSSSWTVAACGACPPASGSQRPRRPSASWPSTPWAWTTQAVRAARLGPGPPQRGRLVLDGHGLPRGGHLPRLGAVLLHGRGHGPGRRRPQPDHAGVGDLPGRRSAQPSGPDRAGTGLAASSRRYPVPAAGARPDPVAPVGPDLRAGARPQGAALAVLDERPESRAARQMS